jgi:hypothetical protein
MAEDKSPINERYFEVVKPEGSHPNDDGTKCLFTFSTTEGRVLLGIPSKHLFQLSAMSLVEGNRACAFAGNLANQQILRSEAVDVRPARDQVDIYFRLAGTKTEIPVSISREAAQTLLARLTEFLAQESAPPTERLQ